MRTSSEVSLLAVSATIRGTTALRWTLRRVDAGGTKAAEAVAKQSASATEATDNCIGGLRLYNLRAMRSTSRLNLGRYKSRR